MKKEAVIITNNRGRVYIYTIDYRLEYYRRADTRISKRADANKLIAAVIFNGQVAGLPALYPSGMYYTLHYRRTHIP